MSLQDVLKAAVEDIQAALCQVPLDARAFARVAFITRRAEVIACAEGRHDEIVQKSQALEDLEAKAPLFYAALRNDLAGGEPLVRQKLLAVEADRALVRQAGQELQVAQDHLVQRSLALSAGEARLLALPARGGASRAATDSDEVEGELELASERPLSLREQEDLDDEEDMPIPDALRYRLDLPRVPEAVAAAEMDEEANRHRQPPLSDTADRPRAAIPIPRKPL